MSKVLATLGFLVVGSGISLTGAYAMGLFSYDVELPVTLDEFKKSNGGSCVKSLFSGIGEMDKNNLGEVAENTVGTSFLGENSQGCLVVNWDKEIKQSNETDKKWRGNIRFLWAVQSGDKGFIVFTVGKAEELSSAKQITWSGIAYQVGKDSQNSSWELKGKKDSESSKTFTSNTDDEGKFPKPGDVLEALNNQSFWGFFEDKNKISHICGTSDCSEGTSMNKSSLRGYWTWEGKSNGEKNLNDWTKDIGKWWKEIFGESKWKMKEVVENKKGAWTKYYFSGLPSVSTEK